MEKVCCLLKTRKSQKIHSSIWFSDKFSYEKTLLWKGKRSIESFFSRKMTQSQMQSWIKSSKGIEAC